VVGPRFLILMLSPVVLGLVAASISRRRRAAFTAQDICAAFALIAIAALLEFLRVSVLAPAEVNTPWVGRCFGTADLALGLLGTLWLGRRLWKRSPLGGWLVVFGVGVVCNSVPVVATGAMPVSLPAARAANIPADLIAAPTAGYVSADQVSPWWAAFGDWIAFPGLEKVLSIGDVFLIVGLAGAVALVLRQLFGFRPLWRSAGEFHTVTKK
jgi:hypothetical protein